MDFAEIFMFSVEDFSISLKCHLGCIALLADVREIDALGAFANQGSEIGRGIGVRKMAVIAMDTFL